MTPRWSRRDRIVAGVPAHYLLDPLYWLWLARRLGDRLAGRRRTPGNAYAPPERVLAGMMDPRHLLVARIVAAAGAHLVLDLGCGYGSAAHILHLWGRTRPPAPSIVGLDRAWKRVRTAQGVGRAWGVPPRWVAADGLRLPFRRGAFDVVLAARYLTEFDDDAEAAAARAEALRVSAHYIVVLDETHRTPWIAPRDHGPALAAAGARLLADRVLPSRWLPNPRAGHWWFGTRLFVAAAGPAAPQDAAVARAAASDPDDPVDSRGRPVA